MKRMTLKSNEIKEKIVFLLKDELFKDGFIYKKTTNEFRHQKNDSTYIFNIEQVAWSSSYSLDVHLYISQSQIESILEKILGKQRHRITLGGEIGDIYTSKNGREPVNGNLSIWLYHNEDVEAAIETLKWYYNDITKPYFKRYDTLEAIDDIINNPPFDHCPAHVGGNFFERCMKGLIVARLVDNPEYEKLVVIYDEEIQGTMNTEFIESYSKVRDYLMYNRIK